MNWTVEEMGFGPHQPVPDWHRHYPLLPPGDGSPCARTTAGPGSSEQHGRPGRNDNAERGIDHSGADRRSGSDPDSGSRIGIEPAHAELAGGRHSDADPLVAGTAAHLTNPDPAVNPNSDVNPDPGFNPERDANPEPNADAVPDSTLDPDANRDPDPNADSNPNPDSNSNSNSNSGADTSPNSLGVRSAGPDPPPDQPCGDGAPECDAAG